MKNKHEHSHEECDCEHHNTDNKENSHSNSCPTSRFVENLLKDLKIEDDKSPE